MGSRRGSLGWVAAGAVVLVLLVGTAALAREVLPLRSILGLADSAECTPDSVYVRLPDNAPSLDNPWRAGQTYPQRRDEVRATALEGQIYVGTGLTVQDGEFRSLSEFFRFDPVQGTYEKLPDIPERVDHAALVGHQGAVYVIGGFRDGRPTSEVWRFSVDTGQWEALAPLLVARGSPAAAVIGDTIYVAGGSRNEQGAATGALSSIESYDIANATWTAIGQDMPTARHHHGAAAIDGRLVVVGGRNGDDLSIDAVEEFDPAEARWTRLAPLPQGVGGLGVVAAGGRVVAVGGGDDVENWLTSATWTLDPAENTWRRLADLNVARHGHGTAAVGRDVYVFAGAPCPGYGTSDAVERLEA